MPIQTLQAFQEQGLTHLPKKSWADIASEEETEDLPLSIMISNLKNKQILNNPSKTIEVRPEPTSSKNPQTPYVSKTQFLDVIQMEPEFWDPKPNTIPSKIFPKDLKGNQFHFKPISPTKTQNFYEFILIDSNSIQLKHYVSKTNPKEYTHSTLQILKVLTLKEYGNPNKLTKFSQNYDPIGYNYWDYEQAWKNVFFLQNKDFRHSWLIYFKQNVQYNFPQWFIKWWEFFGPVLDILPPEVFEGLTIFTKKFEFAEDSFPADLHFFSKLSLSWIFQWQYVYHPRNPQKLPSNTKLRLPMLKRQAQVKWWPQFDSSRAHPDQVRIWLNQHPKYLKAADPEACTFLNQKAQIVAALTASKGKEDFARSLQSILNLLHKEDAGSSSKNPASPSPSTSSEDFYQNEDDCFGINLAED